MDEATQLLRDGMDELIQAEWERQWDQQTQATPSDQQTDE